MTAIPPRPYIGTAVGVVSSGRHTTGVIVEGPAAAGKVYVEFLSAKGQLVYKQFWWHGDAGGTNGAYPLAIAAAVTPDTERPDVVACDECGHEVPWAEAVFRPFGTFCTKPLCELKGRRARAGEEVEA